MFETWVRAVHSVMNSLGHHGPYFTTAYIAKAIEIALIALIAIDFARHDGNPVAVARRELTTLVALVTRRSRTAGAGA